MIESGTGGDCCIIQYTLTVCRMEASVAVAVVVVGDLYPFLVWLVVVCDRDEASRSVVWIIERECGKGGHFLEFGVARKGRLLS